MQQTAQSQNLNSGYHWAAREAARSDDFRTEVDALRVEARCDRPRTGVRPVDYTFPELERMPGDWNDVPEHQRRPRAWQDPIQRYGLRYVERYCERVRKLAGTKLGGKQVAPQLHELIRQEVGYLVETSGLTPLFGPPVGSRASSGAAHISGASWGSGTVANRQAYYRAYDVSRTFIH